MIITLLGELRTALATLLNENVCSHETWCHVVDLDSSTEKKFSRHLILRLNEGATAFASNADVGRFVHALCTDFLARAAQPRMSELFVAPPARTDGVPAADAQRVSIIDLTVYSRHRCFRLYKSSKVGKRAELVPAAMSQESLFLMPHAEEMSLFMASLVTNVPSGASLLRVDGDDATSSADAGNALLGVRLPRPPMSDSAPCSAGAMHRGDCPYADLAAFVLNAWTHKAGLPSRLYRWSVEEKANREAVTLALGPENRWCAHVLRPHRSNGTFLRVDLRKRAFAQFCFDADCRAAGFRGSDWLPVPAPLCDGALSLMASSTAVGVEGAALVSEAALAALPLDEIVAAYRDKRGRDYALVPPALDDGLWLSDEVLAAMPLDA